jgi:hypothetical protein
MNTVMTLPFDPSAPVPTPQEGAGIVGWAALPPDRPVTLRRWGGAYYLTQAPTAEHYWQLRLQHLEDLTQERTALALAVRPLLEQMRVRTWDRLPPGEEFVGARVQGGWLRVVAEPVGQPGLLYFIPNVTGEV